MNKVLLAFLALLAAVSAANVDPYLNAGDLTEAAIRKNGITGRGIILSSKGKKVVKNFVKQFENGYTKDEITIDIKKPLLEMNVKVKNFTVMGFDNVEIKKLNIGFTLSKSVKFNFLLPKVNISGKVLTNSFIDALSEFGFKLTGNVESDVELTLENITFQGYFKYTMPIIFGSIEIYKFDASIVVGNIVSRIDGLLGNGKINRLLNEAVEEILLKLVNSNQDKISTMLKDTLVPYANSKLKGSNIWSVIG